MEKLSMYIVMRGSVCMVPSLTDSAFFIVATTERATRLNTYSWVLGVTTPVIWQRSGVVQLAKVTRWRNCQGRMFARFVRPSPQANHIEP